MKESHQFRLECSLLYGTSGLGVVASNTSGVLVLTSASWSVGTWAAGMQNATLEAWTSTAASATQHNGTLTISSVNIANQSVTVTGTNSSVVANDILYFQSARTSTAWNECNGIFSILNASSSIFNIDPTIYNLWLAQSYAVGGNLSLTAIMQAAATAIPFGLKDAMLLCSPNKFAELASDEAALRRYVTDQPKAKRGVKGIVFTLGSVDVEILPHPIMKSGDGFMLASDSWHRTGATDVTFALPGGGQELSVMVTDSTAIELRSMSDMGIFSEMPAQNVYMSGIT